jgi:ribonuclease Z
MSIVKTINVDIGEPMYRLVGGSVAGMGTNWTFPTIGITFDAGFLTDETISCPVMAFSHHHMDHIASLMLWVSQRSWKKMGKSTIVCHKKMVPFLTRYMQFTNEFDGRVNDVDIVGVEHGEQFKIKSNMSLVGYPMNHRKCPEATAWVVTEKRSKLKAEYVGLVSQEIAKLSKTGVKVSDTLHVPIVAYTGDYLWDSQAETLFGAFLSQPPKVVITECTFTEPGSEEEAKEGRHVHLTHAGEVFKACVDVGIHLVVGHFSQREYTKMIAGNFRKVVGETGYTLAPVRFEKEDR